MSKLKANAYVDGSFNPTTATMGSAVILAVNNNHRPHRLSFHRQIDSLKKYGSNIAEINAAKTAIKTANSLGITDITIYHDWNGLELFSHIENIKPRHSNCPCYSQYAEFVEKKRKNMRIQFVKVKAHSGVEQNNLADKMARASAVI